MSTRGQSIFSGEPLPVPPRVKDAELESFHRKLIDYLRRLAGKLGTYVDDGGGGGSGGTSTLVFTAYPDDTGYGASGSGAPSEVMRWQNILRSDSIYSYNSTYGYITVSEAGTYIVHFDVLTTKNFATEFQVIIADAIGGIDASTPEYGECHPYLSGSPDGDSFSFMVPMELDAGDRIGVLIATADQVIQKAGSRLFIEKLGAE